MSSELVPYVHLTGHLPSRRRMIHRFTIKRLSRRFLLGTFFNFPDLHNYERVSTCCLIASML